MATAMDDSRASTEGITPYKDLKIKPRDYQLELLDSAIEENTIVNLGTGSGKTFIAVMMIREFQHEILGCWETHKRTIFIVNSVALVRQQGDYIKENLSVSVGQYTGDMNVDSWNLGKWKEEFSFNHVLVMTHQIYLNILNHFPTDLPLSKVNLLIVDECHHCTKNHPYREIMKHFENWPKEYLPRVLGLTASIVKAKVKPGSIAKVIRELEVSMRCRCQTAKDLISVSRFATRPNESIEVYAPSTGDDLMSPLKDPLQATLKVFQSFSKEQMMSSKHVYQFCKDYISDTVYTIDSLGVASACTIAKQFVRNLEEIYHSPLFNIEKEESKLLEAICTALKVFRAQVNSRGDIGEDDTTPKVKKLLQILGDFGIKSGELLTRIGGESASSQRPEKLCGIVFVERRSTAARLCQLIEHFSKNQSDLKYIRPGFIIGHGSAIVGKEMAMNATKQDKVLELFRSQRINLLIATNVVEEGLDVPKCNLVVRFDLPKEVRGYIQSKGRARARNSQYIMMVEDGPDRMKQESEIEIFGLVEKELRELVQEARTVPDEDEISAAAEDILPPFAPYGNQGPRVTFTESLSLVHMYCQKLPHDAYTKTQPVFDLKKVPKMDPALDSMELPLYLMKESHTEQFQATVTLPLPCPLREPIQGPAMETQQDARRAAALEAVKKLHEIGALNSSLLPVVFSLADSDDEDDKDIKEMKKEKNIGTERRNERYSMHYPSLLSDCFSGVAKDHFLYVFHVRDARSNEYYQPGPGAPFGCVDTFGILTQRRLPMSIIPKFSLYVGDATLEVTVEECLYAVNPTELVDLVANHQYIIENILGIKAPFMKFSPDHAPRNYLIVPVKVYYISSPSTANIDSTLLNSIRRGRAPRGEIGPGTLVYRPYMKQHSDSQGLLEVDKVDDSQSPESRFPDKNYSTYLDFFREKHNVVIVDRRQKMLICSHVSKRTELLSSRFKSRKGEDFETRGEDKKRKTIELFPEICSVFPLPSNIYKLIHCLPAILWRIESILVAEELRKDIQSQTEVGLISGADVMVDADLTGYGDRNAFEMKYRVVMEDGSAIPIPDFNSLRDNGLHCLIGPGPALLLQALTLKSTEDVFDLERLETFGDSFLKLVTSCALFCSQKYYSEGQLTGRRAAIISNSNLFCLAKKKNLASNIFRKVFKAREMWLPPGYELGEMEKMVAEYATKSIPDKSVADCMESLIGAYLTCGGMAAALKFMHWLGIKLPRQPDDREGVPIAKKLKMLNDLPMAETFFRLVTSSRSIFQDLFSGWRLPPVKENQRNKLSKLQAGLDQLEQRLDYHFNEKRYLVEALTHASYTKNQVTNCYQKLEFLGDAVLDYLITAYTFHKFPSWSPGDLTHLRSALVNNNTFGELSMKLGLNKFLKHESIDLFKGIQDYQRQLKGQSVNDWEGLEEDEIICLEGLKQFYPEADSGSADTDDEWADCDVLYAPKVLGDILESVTGSIFIDSGMDLEKVWAVFSKHFEPLIETYSDKIPLTPVDELDREAPGITKYNKPQPSTFPRPKGFIVKLTVLRKSGVPPIQVRAYSNTKVGAKHNAAKKALRLLHSNT